MDRTNASLSNPRSLPFLPQGQLVLLQTEWNENRLAQMVSQQVGCLVTIINTENYNMSTLALMARTTKRHIIFKLGGRRPTNRDLILSDRPFIWIENRHTVNVFVPNLLIFCVICHCLCTSR